MCEVMEIGGSVSCLTLVNGWDSRCIGYDSSGVAWGRRIMKAAVDRVYTFLVLKEQDRKTYEALLNLGERYTTAWDEPVLTKNF